MPYAVVVPCLLIRTGETSGDLFFGPGADHGGVGQDRFDGASRRLREPVRKRITLR